MIKNASITILLLEFIDGCDSGKWGLLPVESLSYQGTVYISDCLPVFVDGRMTAFYITICVTRIHRASLMLVSYAADW